MVRVIPKRPPCVVAWNTVRIRSTFSGFYGRKDIIRPRIWTDVQTVRVQICLLRVVIPVS